MAHATKELEDRIQELGSKLSSPPGAAEELLPLLDQADGFLSRVEQSPSDSMLAVLRPLMDALVTDELLRHSDMDVKVSVASCISEITRITAPDAPYDDDLMKDIFKMIVESFERLDDTASPSFRRRVSILETVAKVRSCVVMLDLECDALILEMFRHFLKTIRSNHPENVFSSMETIMSLVIEESEDVSSELVSLLLSHVKNDNEDVTPIACNLVEKVMGSCAGKLKPLLAEAVQSTGAVSEYSKIVASICQENSDALEQNINASGETLADDSKLSERTVSDELPQLEQEVGCQEKVGNARDNSPMAVMSNGTIQIGNGDSTGEQPSPKLKSERSRRSEQSKNIVAADSDNLEPVAVKPDGISDPTTKKVRGRKTTTSVQLTDTTDHSQNDSDKEASAATSRRKGLSKEADTSEVDTKSGKELETVDHFGPVKKTELQLPQGSDNVVPSVASPTPIGSSQDATRRKRGRPSKKNVVNAAADEHASASGVKGSLRKSRTQDEVLTAKNVDDEKELRGDESEGKPRRRSGKKAHSENVDDGEGTETVISDPEGKPERNMTKTPKGKVSRGESSGRKQKSSAKQRMKEESKDVPGEPTLKVVLQEMVSSPTDTKKAPSKTQSEDGAKTKSGRKRSRFTEEIAETSVQKKGKLDESLVGAKVKVWWPDDVKFYEGTVTSFDHKSKKHEVCYDDGDVENLLLKNECWQFAGQAKDITNTDDLQMSQRKKAKQTSLSASKRDRTGSPLKSGTESGNRTEELVIKRKGRPRKSVNDDTPMSNRNLRAKAASEDEGVSPKTSTKLKDDHGNKSRETPRHGGRIKDGTPNTSANSKDVTTIPGKDEASKSRRKSKFSSPEANSMPKHDTLKISSNSKEDAVPSEAVSKKDEVAGGGKSIRGTTGSSGRGRRGSATPRSRSSGGSTADGTSDKGKSKIRQGENSTGEKESSGKARTKRKRRGGRS